MLIQPGELIQHDYRQQSQRLSHGSSSSPPSLRCVQWNIERGYQLAAVIGQLRAVDADIISLQEIDVGCERSGGVDTGCAIAEALQLNYAYLCEFHELLSPLRSPQLQGGAEAHHGHAVLTKHELLHVSCLRHSHQPVDWEKQGETRREPRRGERATLKVVVGCHGGAVPVLVYNSHFELFCGLLDRLHALADILHDARRESQRYPQQMILADCNTSPAHCKTSAGFTHGPLCTDDGYVLWPCRMGHGIARLSRSYCTDAMRLRSLGWTESEWWTHYVLSQHDSSGPVNRLLLPFFPPSSPLPAQLRNPGFHEPFDPYDDVTLVSHSGWYQGKLDWLLLRGFIATRHWMGNDDYRASDHRWLAADVELSRGATARGGRVRRRRPGMCTCTTDDRLYVLQLLSLCAVLSALLAALWYR